MKNLTSFIAAILVEAIIKIFKQSGPKYVNGHSDSKIEKKFREKAKKDGWNV